MHWIIGDIHGMLAPLETLIKEIDRRDKKRRLIFAGDYVNRGPDSKRVIDLLLDLPNSRFIRGNHDDVFDQVLHAQSYCGKPGDYERTVQFRWFMNFGLFQTFLSYGVDESDIVRADQQTSTKRLDELRDHVPQKHRDFIRNLPPVVEESDFFVLHAKWDIDRATESPSISDQLLTSPKLRETIVWGRFSEKELAAEKAWRRRGYFGHTPVTVYSDRADAVPIVANKTVLVDTGAALPEGRRLTAFCHESNEFVQADASGELLTT